MREPGAASLTVRHPRDKNEWRRVRELCCLTGNAGEAIAVERWPFFGEHWIGPYERCLPRWTYVAELGGAIHGYLTGCPDTRAFERARKLRFDARLVSRIAAGRFAYNDDVRRYLRRLFHFERAPNDRFPREVLSKIAHEYPAHLHVNVDTLCRGKGVGAKLMEAFFAELRGQGTRGVHVFCGAGPVRFYEREGFRELGRIELARAGAKPVAVFALGKALG